ncbi:sensor histidine kinase [Nocardia pseudobrasiliensis]|uniref:histidine kinase n=1 Tax=Nocardia pseudobrasiliensis TaxID=45979 RepID=A0A370HW67_9NOCA|nr:histidine kinase [Nocardia pseudobrasiliensis]RDI62747.1 signal transduction histidine kinase [Nocardia pseudobrasiliensis]
MRQRLLGVGRRLIGDDPETSPLMRMISTSLLAVNLVYNHSRPVPVWMWVVSVVAYLGFVAYAVLAVRRPRLAMAGLIAATLISAAIVPPATDTAPLFLACASLSILSQQLVPSALVILAVTVADGVTMTVSTYLTRSSTDDLAINLAILCVLMLLGLYRRQYRMRVDETALLLEQTRRAQHEQARAAALDERARIARELHDVLAHSLGALAVQLDVAEGLLSEKGDLSGALSRVRRSRRLAANGMTEARAAVAALRNDIPPLDEALRGLVDGYRRDHHMTVDCQVTGVPRAMDSAAAVSLLGAAREALTNASKHAPGAPVSIVLTFDTDRVRLLVSNPAARNGNSHPEGGYGLTGMRERIALAGGSLSAGPGQDGRGWLVTVEVPE